MSAIVTSYTALLLAILFETVATSCLKLSEQFTRLIPSLFCAACYGASFYFLSHVLRTLPVGIAYAVWSGLGIVLISLIGKFAFKQHLDLPACIGLGLIITGVIVVNVFSKSVAH